MTRWVWGAVGSAGSATLQRRQRCFEGTCRRTWSSVGFGSRILPALWRRGDFCSGQVNQVRYLLLFLRLAKSSGLLLPWRAVLSPSRACRGGVSAWLGGLRVGDCRILRLPGYADRGCGRSSSFGKRPFLTISSLAGSRMPVCITAWYPTSSWYPAPGHRSLSSRPCRVFRRLRPCSI